MNTDSITLERLTGASVKLISQGSNVRIIIEGNSNAEDESERQREKANQVAIATTLLFNYRAISWPDWYDGEAQATFGYMDIRAAQDTFKRGYMTLVYAEETQRHGKHDHRARVMRAGRKAIGQLRELFKRGEVRDVPLPDLSHIADSESDGMEIA